MVISAAMIEDQKRSPWIGVMETLDGWGYITAGFSFLVLGMIVFAHLGLQSANLPHGKASGDDLNDADLRGFGHTWVNQTQGRVLVVILLELFRTIINFLKTHVITLEPFLYICIIASTRRILTTGAATAYTKDLTQEVFHQYLLDIGVNVLVIVALVFAVYMASKRTAPPLSP